MMDKYEVAAMGSRNDWAVYRLQKQVERLEEQVNQLKQLEKTVSYLKEVMAEQIKRHECEKLRAQLSQLEKELKEEEAE